jgi:hypothetical protein
MGDFHLRPLIIENPIIDPPFVKPERHSKFSDNKITDQILGTRRPRSHLVPIAQPPKKSRDMRFIIMLLYLSVIELATGVPTQKWMVQEYWDRLEVKMTEQVVIDLLGEPFEKKHLDSGDVWYYQTFSEQNDFVSPSRLRKGLLRFKRPPNDSFCLLYKWQEPDWTITAQRTEAQYLIEQTRIENQFKQEQARLERERVIALRKALQTQQRVESERLAIEQQNLRQQQIEEAKQRRAEKTRVAKQRSDAQTALQAKNKTSSFEITSYKYWFTMAGLLILAAIGFSFAGYFKKG